MSWWSDLLEKFGGTVFGGALIVGGVAGAWLTKKYISENYKLLGYTGSLAIGGYGAYKIYSELKKPKGEKPTPNLTFPIVITDPRPGTKWSRLRPHSVNVEVANNYSKIYNLFVGMSMIHEKGEVFDFPIQSFTIKPGEIKKLSFWMYGSPQGSGLYWIVSSVWDVFPVPPCEEMGTCHRLGTAESNVTFGYF